MNLDEIHGTVEATIVALHDHDILVLYVPDELAQDPDSRELAGRICRTLVDKTGRENVGIAILPESCRLQLVERIKP